MKRSLKKSLALILTMFMVAGFSGLASAALVTYELSTGSTPIELGNTFSVDIYLTAEAGDNPSFFDMITQTSFGAFFDYDDSYMTFISATPGANWVDNRVFMLEPTSDWYTAAGWTGLGYTAPSGFEEGPDLLVMSLISFLDAQSTAPTTPPILLGTIEFQCTCPGDSIISAFNRPDANWISGTINDNIPPDEHTLHWGTSKTTISQIPIPGAILLFGSGLLGLLGIGIRRRTKK